MGPNVRKLICHHMSTVMVPPNGGIADALEALTTPGRLTEVAKESTEWVRQALEAVKSAPNNPFSSDEEIAGEILKRVEEKLRQRRISSK